MLAAEQNNEVKVEDFASTVQESGCRMWHGVGGCGWVWKGVGRCGMVLEGVGCERVLEGKGV